MAEFKRRVVIAGGDLWFWQYGRKSDVPHWGDVGVLCNRLLANFDPNILRKSEQKSGFLTHYTR